MVNENYGLPSALQEAKKLKIRLGWSPTSPLWGNNGFRLFFGGSQTLFGSLFFCVKGATRDFEKGAAHDFEKGWQTILRKDGTRFCAGEEELYEGG